MISLTGKTQVGFLIGSPFSQVLAPWRLTTLMHNRKEDAILVTLEVRQTSWPTPSPS